MRAQLHQKLKAIGCPGNWDHITSQQGMFSYTGLNGECLERWPSNLLYGLWCYRAEGLAKKYSGADRMIKVRNP